MIPPRDESIPTLVRASQAGDRAALEELLRRCLPSVRAFVRLRMGPELRARESCSDVVQSVCSDLLSARGLVFDDELKFRNWLYVAALNKLRDHDRALHTQKREVAREVALSEDGDVTSCYASVLSPSRELLGRERIARLEAAFDELPEHYREVVTLARVARLSNAQIAASTGRTEDAVRNILTRALNKLATLLEDDD
jgi:RNA polymerase sigma-70 factor (ECF subfamily)